MPMTLLEQMKSSVTPQFAGYAAKLLGETPANIEKAIGLSVPAILSGTASAAHVASGQTGQSVVSRLVSDPVNDGTLLHRLPALYQGTMTAAPIYRLGAQLLQAIFGSKLGKVTQTIAALSGIKPASSALLISTLAPHVLAILGKRHRLSGEATPTGLAHLFDTEHTTLAAAVPAALSQLIGTPVAANATAAAAPVSLPKVAKPTASQAPKEAVPVVASKTVSSQKMHGLTDENRPTVTKQSYKWSSWLPVIAMYGLGAGGLALLLTSQTGAPSPNPVTGSKTAQISAAAPSPAPTAGLSAPAKTAEPTKPVAPAPAPVKIAEVAKPATPAAAPATTPVAPVKTAEAAKSVEPVKPAAPSVAPAPPAPAPVALAPLAPAPAKTAEVAKPVTPSTAPPSTAPPSTAPPSVAIPSGKTADVAKPAAAPAATAPVKTSEEVKPAAPAPAPTAAAVTLPAPVSPKGVTSYFGVTPPAVETTAKMNPDYTPAALATAAASQTAPLAAVPAAVAAPAAKAEAKPAAPATAATADAAPKSANLQPASPQGVTNYYGTTPAPAEQAAAANPDYRPAAPAAKAPTLTETALAAVTNLIKSAPPRPTGVTSYYGSTPANQEATARPNPDYKPTNMAAQTSDKPSTPSATTPTTPVTAASADIAACSTSVATAVKKGRIVFQSARAELKNTSIATLDRLIVALKACPNARLKVEGHTDSTGLPEMNQKLSQARAQTVADYLAAKGVDAAKVTAVGLGATRPVAPNTTALNKARNRRIEFGIESL